MCYDKDTKDESRAFRRSRYVCGHEAFDRFLGYRTDGCFPAVSTIRYASWDAASNTSAGVTSIQDRLRRYLTDKESLLDRVDQEPL